MSSCYLPGDKLDEGYELDVDLSAYDIYLPFMLEWPCLSFDILSDSLGDERVKDPFSFSFIAGTQADYSTKNSLISCTVSSIYKRKKDQKSKKEEVTANNISEDESSDDGSDEEEDEARSPRMVHHNTSVAAGCNRIKSFDSSRGDDRSQKLVACCMDNGTVEVYALEKVNATNKQPSYLPTQAPIGKVSGHKTEGYSLSWSSYYPKLLSGDCGGCIYLSTVDSNSSISSKRVAKLENVSFEDLEWSPTDENLFAACSTDGLLRIFDVRSSLTANQVQLSSSDINVLSWNKSVPHLVATGDENGVICVVDLRMIGQSDLPVIASFDWHKAPVSSIEWNPNDSAILGSSGLDNQISLWDLSLEEDKDAMDTGDTSLPVPPQLLFIHQGQNDVKEIHWHRQIPGLLVSTAADGFNIIKTINI